ncbi:MAG: chloride channel protein [Thermaerobacter sp.]|nr:chloride channel protein [Thermaerobacter sp.]
MRKPVIPEPVLIILLAVVVGVVGGVGAVLFRLMIQYAQVGFRWLAGASFHMPHVTVAIMPVLGLLAVGVISTYFAREVKGHGVPQILEALALRGGRIRPRVGFFGILAPALTIGSGGSVGREGPIALIGAAFGSSLGQSLKLPDRYTMLLVGCGTAAGIGATFNAPIAGALFAMEVVLGSYAMGTLVPCFVASVTGVSVFNLILGDHLALTVPSAAFHTPVSLVLMGALGILAGLFGIAYTRGLTYFEDLFDNWHASFWQRALVGGLFVGLLGLVVPQVLGVGYGTMNAVATGKIFGIMVLLLLVAKYFATLVTIGAGGSGGVFAPSLFLGLMLGTAFGTVVHGLAPGTFAPASVFGVAGMGAVFAATAQAPLTAAVIVLEMTGDYRLAMGTVLACALSYFLYGSMQRDTMYTVRLSRRGIRILRGSEVRPLQSMLVKTAMRSLETRVVTTDTLQSAQLRMVELHADALVVEDEYGAYAGVLEAPTVLAATGKEGLDALVGSVSLNRVPPVSQATNLDEAMQRFALYDTDLLPVADHQKLLGLLTRRDVLQAYQTHTTLSLETDRKVALLQQETGSSGAFQSFGISPGSPIIGIAIRDLRLPQNTLIVAVERGATVVVPHGDTTIQEDDRVVVYANPPAGIDEVRKLLSSSQRVKA